MIDTLQDKLNSNIDRLKADAKHHLRTSPCTPALVGSEYPYLPDTPEEYLAWSIGYYDGLMRALEVLEGYDD